MKGRDALQGRWPGGKSLVLSPSLVVVVAVVLVIAVVVVVVRAARKNEIVPVPVLSFESL